MKKLYKIGAGLVLAISAWALPGTAALAAGDLLVAPTRIVLDGERGAEVILNNIGNEEATYRISLQLRRMTPDGRLQPVSEEEANQIEQAALSMIRYAPRRVTLAPNQPQAIRIGVRPPEGLPDGEYRAHLQFRAIPRTRAVTERVDPGEGLSISLTPVYGVTIPVIIRHGRLESQATLANVRMERASETPEFVFDLGRQGASSVYGVVTVTRQSGGDPLLTARGVAVYPELSGRTVRLPVSADVSSDLSGPMVLELRHPANIGGGLIARNEFVLP